MKHIVLTRFIYDDTDHAQNRLSIMNETLIHSLKNQINKNFVWALMCRPYHRDQIKNIYGGDIMFFKDSVDFKDHMKKDKFQIQTRHDSDDLMCNEYIDLIQNDYQNNKFRKDPFIIHFQPTLNKYGTKNFYKFHLDYEKSNSTSAFISLCPQESDKTIWDHTHTSWVGKVQTIIRNKTANCVSATIHDLNTTTKLSHKDKKI